MSIKRQLGRTDLYVTPIGLGTNAVGGHNLFQNLNDETGKEMVRTALEHGINFLDTAYIYGPERSEQLIGEVLKEKGSGDEIIIATKGARLIQGISAALILNLPPALHVNGDREMGGGRTDETEFLPLYLSENGLNRAWKGISPLYSGDLAETIRKWRNKPELFPAYRSRTAFFRKYKGHFPVRTCVCQRSNVHSRFLLVSMPSSQACARSISLIRSTRYIERPVLHNLISGPCRKE